MKKISLIFFFTILFAFFSFQAWAKDVTVQWDPTTQPQLVDHYELWAAPWSDSQYTGPFVKLADVPLGTSQYVATGLTEGTYYVFGVYAVSTDGIYSLMSNIATDQKLVIPNSVENLRVK